MWYNDRNINFVFSIPYYNQNNDRFERVNRMIIKGLKKEKGDMIERLKSVVSVYNGEVIHRAIGITFKEALTSNNHDPVIKNMSTYEREFKIREIEKFN